MATKSFYETMVIDTPEAAANLAKAIDDYEQLAHISPALPRGSVRIPKSSRRSRKRGSDRLRPAEAVLDDFGLSLREGRIDEKMIPCP